MDSNNKQQSTDQNQQEANKIPRNESMPQDDKLSKGQNDQLKTAQDFDQTVKEAEAETQTRKPGESLGGNSNQNNNGRGGGK